MSAAAALPPTPRLSRSPLAAAALALILAACATHGPPPPTRGGPEPPPAGAEPLNGRPGSPEAANADSLTELVWSPFGKPERGWETYLPFVAREIAAPSIPASRAFTRALERWQRAHDLPADGVFTPADFARMKADELQRRPFVRLRATGVCPAPPPEDTLVSTTPAESWRGRTTRLRPETLAAWRAMVAAARRDVPALRYEPDAFKIFSGYRSPDYDAERCAVEKNCDGLRRAQCSSHRTGLTVDMVLDARPPVDSTADADRLRESRSLAYRWLVDHADRYGFVNYLYEPWHWEWTGEAP